MNDDPKPISLVAHRDKKRAKEREAMESPGAQIARQAVEAFQDCLCDQLKRKDGHPMDLVTAKELLTRFWTGPIAPWHTQAKEKIGRCPFKEGDRIQYEETRYFVARFRPEGT